MAIQERYRRSRVGNAHVHLGRFLAFWMLMTAATSMTYVLTFQLLTEPLNDAFVMWGFLGAVGTWLPAAMVTSYLAGRGGGR